MRVGLLAVLGSLLLGAPARAQGEDLLPDVVVDTSRSFVTRIDTDSFAGRTLLRLSSATANVGVGRLEVRASAVISETQREVVQRIYRSDGSFRERLAGTFTYHPDHGHFHFDEWALFRLRRLAADGTPGEVVAEGEKTSFCLVDFAVDDASNPSFRDPPFYTTCDAGFQGITPGWSDLYTFTLPGQWIDATGVPDGVYWLEITADPERRILEADATNNTAGRPVALFPSGIPDDPYEENDSFDAVLAREEAAPGSPNLGLVNAPRALAGLSMSDALDYFRFRLNATGDAGSFVRTDSPHALGDVDLFVVDESRAVVGSSRGRTSREAVSLEGLPAGAYTALVRRESGVVPDYSLLVDPPANGPPEVEWLAPAAGGVFVERGRETARVAWVASDPEGDPTRVALFADRDRTFDASAVALPGLGALPGEAGAASVETGGLGVGPWFVYAEISDGGAAAGAFAPGALVVYEKGDLDLDGDVDRADFAAAARLHARRARAGDSAAAAAADLDRDGDVDPRDLQRLGRRIQDALRAERRAR